MRPSSNEESPATPHAQLAPAPVQSTHACSFSSGASACARCSKASAPPGRLLEGVSRNVQDQAGGPGLASSARRRHCVPERAGGSWTWFADGQASRARSRVHELAQTTRRMHAPARFITVLPIQRHGGRCRAGCRRFPGQSLAALAGPPCLLCSPEAFIRSLAHAGHPTCMSVTPPVRGRDSDLMLSSLHTSSRDETQPVLDGLQAARMAHVQHFHMSSYDHLFFGAQRSSHHQARVTHTAHPSAKPRSVLTLKSARPSCQA
ncbi:hypothetical protein PsYK624_054740 [Phanerochaete sordida]|uniref:Uncharacterized protein n=1 Tax=Phanerochaete sordida TaxID=48140 RepID=A0A9P3G8K0_9APHY|nr:hypothetical protein PsYK624_054740 [Phanerochaete sordida]